MFLGYADDIKMQQGGMRHRILEGPQDKTQLERRYLRGQLQYYQ